MTPRYRQSLRLAQRRIGEDYFIVDPASKCLHQPLDAGEFIWDCLKKPASMDNLIESLRDEYEIDADTAQKDVRRFLRELLRKRLIEEVAN